ncbi:cupin domain-containing protein [Oceanobacillus sp. 143]|uniref:Cupin domain-containing protein n=1 Tax=Oceanobacillus zhaokaii TaxID=2052660 RepID=A0A345PLX8_9BACI|nr:cupin domain-containing protein [Oceanobacillus zhaokaii]AXI11008.1 cupin domain-containing protein [Oceanobacillus zhaokaii]QGS69997.1 cupin domain-containing protein [Oceanobacillus sp. 143]
MYAVPYVYPYPYYVNTPIYTYNTRQPMYWGFTESSAYANRNLYLQTPVEEGSNLKDFGKGPFIVKIDKAAEQNNTFRTVLWTGNHLQVTVMSLNIGEDTGLEVHPNADQFIRIEDGQGIVQIGDKRGKYYILEKVHDDDAIIVPAGKWHNLINTGDKALKLYTIYAPPQYPLATIHRTKADAIAAHD